MMRYANPRLLHVTLRDFASFQIPVWAYIQSHNTLFLEYL